MEEAVRAIMGMPPSFTWHDVCALGYCLYREILHDVVRVADCTADRFYDPMILQLANAAMRQGKTFTVAGDIYLAPWKREIALPRFVCKEETQQARKTTHLLDEHIWGAMACAQPTQTERTQVCSVPLAGSFCLIKRDDWFYWAILLSRDEHAYDAPSGAVFRIFLDNIDGSVVSTLEKAVYYKYKVNDTPVHILLAMEYTGMYSTYTNPVSKSVEVLHKIATEYPRGIVPEPVLGINVVNRF